MPDDAIIEVPLFPLDGVVLFPGTVHPFHIFEERYRRLVGDALEGPAVLAIPLFKPGWEEQYFEAPAVHRIAGLGKIIEHEILEEGRYNIVVLGCERIRIIRELREKPYRVAEAEIVGDLIRPEDREVIREEIGKLRRLCEKLMLLFPQFLRDLAPLAFDPNEASRTADQIANKFVRDVYDRQSILNEPDVCRRLQLTRVQLMLLLQRFLGEIEYQEFMAALDAT